MADEPVDTPPANNDPQPASAGVSQTDKGGVSSPSADPVKMAEELGRLKKVEADYQRYVTDVDPVIQTLYSDQELFQKVGDVHRKRLGISPPDSPDQPKDPVPIAPSQPSQESKDTRNYLVSQVVKDFYSKHGIDKLDKEKKEQLDHDISMVLKETLNPTGSKTLGQILEDVPLDFLPTQLDKAYYWATRAEREASLKEEGKREAMLGEVGMIGSMASQATSSEEISLTAKEMEICREAGWDPQKYLENKKEIIQRNNKLY